MKREWLPGTRRHKDYFLFLAGLNGAHKMVEVPERF